MKHLLAVFMALLLVLWLAGDALVSRGGGGPQASNEPRGVAFGETVRFGDMQPAFRDIEKLRSMRINWQIAWESLLAEMGLASQYLPLLGMEPIRQEELSPTEWFMLDLAAREAGIEVSAEALERFKQRERLSDVVLSQIRDHFKVSLAELNQTLRSFVRVIEAAELVVKSVKPSEADIQEFVRQTQEKVRVSALMVNARVDDGYVPTAEELQAQFEQSKDKDPVPGNPTEFGCRLPEKVQVEYIEINANVLGHQQDVKEEEAREYWAAHKEEFLKPVTPPATSPTTTQATPPEPKPYETATEALPKVIEKLRDQRGREEAMRLGRELISLLNRPWLNQPTTQPGDYSEPPESETTAEIYPRIIESLEGRYPGALKYGRTQLNTASELAGERSIASARLRQGSQQQVPFIQAAFMVAGLEADPATNPEHVSLFRNIWQTCSEPAVGWNGDVYVFRTVAAQPKQVPGTVDEVKDKLVQDIRWKHAYQEAERVARELMEKASSSGLQATYDASGELKDRLRLVEPPPFARQRSRSYGPVVMLQPEVVSSLGGGAEMVDLCFSMVSEAATQPVALKLHEQPRAARWMVIQFHELIPVTQAEYDAARADAFNRNLLERRVDLLREWFDPQQIRERVGWQDVKPPKADGEKANSEEQPANGAETG